jgi:hypothetical protein
MIGRGVAQSLWHQLPTQARLSSLDAIVVLWRMAVSRRQRCSGPPPPRHSAVARYTPAPSSASTAPSAVAAVGCGCSVQSFTHGLVPVCSLWALECPSAHGGSWGQPATPDNTLTTPERLFANTGTPDQFEARVGEDDHFPATGQSAA